MTCTNDRCKPTLRDVGSPSLLTEIARKALRDYAVQLIAAEHNAAASDILSLIPTIDRLAAAHNDTLGYQTSLSDL